MNDKMTENEYLKKVKEIRRVAWFDIVELMRDYAVENNQIKLGDIISNHAMTIKVEKVRLYRNELKPSLIYSGIRLTKAKKPFKSGEKASIYQMNLRE